MKKAGLCLLAVLISSTAWAQSPSFKVKIIQNGIAVEPKDDVYYLKSEAFSFAFTAQDVDGFLVGATFDDDLYRSAIGTVDLEVSWFANTGIADGRFNPDQELMVTNDAPSYWYYTDNMDHRFDENPTGTADNYVAKRTILRFKDLAVDKVIPVEDFKKSVYIYMYSGDRDDDFNLIDIETLFYGELKFNTL
ncbi:hypothetical protein KO02_10470 [Sphingobacterium sp. ML3W]|uniref:hypothetical protein n=1 Tax=Sphingobacterium sp. ML3W TaxID=1538644 RepID=UPI0004F77CB7|nr:hypothetical protein [Sphingobacterium sp. ML3W]AIM37073.1 hypothetical protein KO02_10470 [Sphingobacterium sp. ML3W]